MPIGRCRGEGLPSATVYAATNDEAMNSAMARTVAALRISSGTVLTRLEPTSTMVSMGVGYPGRSGQNKVRTTRPPAIDTAAADPLAARRVVAAAVWSAVRWDPVRA